jgi:hypothetical protein
MTRMRSRICSSTISGCQPTASRISKIWDLALRGIDEAKRELTLTYLVQNRERITATDLDSLIKEAESPEVLDNLTLNARQRDPHRDVLIQIGPGKDTSVTVEAEDHTWAIGRHTEIMEALYSTRKRYAPGKPPKYISWPDSRRPNKQSIAKRSALFIVTGVGTVIVTFALWIALTIYVALIVEPPYILIDRAIHHESIHARTKAFVIVSLALICVTVYLVAAAFFANQSKVIIHKKTFWTKSRIASSGVIAAVVSALAAVLALLK